MWPKIQKWRDKNFILLDTVESSLLAWIFMYWAVEVFSFKRLNLFDISSVYFTLGWFLLSVFALLFSFKDGKKIQRLQKSTHYKEVFNIFLNAISRCMVFAFVFLILNFITWEVANYIVSTVWISFFIVAVKLYRCIRIIKEIAFLSIDIE